MSGLTEHDREIEDAAQVDLALEALGTGNITEAKRILVAVAENCPSDYAHQLESDDGSLSIKFWDRNEFTHYVTWDKPGRDIKWISSAYPRALYYLGFIAVQEGRFQDALRHFDQGASLEPTNPKFRLEMAQVLAHSGQHLAALDLYASIGEVGPFVSGYDIAVATRGIGFVLIEMGRIEDAEAAFLASLQIEPGSKLAQDELRYIAHLKRGGGLAPPQLVETEHVDVTACATCGARDEPGRIINIDGVPICVCNKCRKKLTKKWWQFWK